MSKYMKQQVQNLKNVKMSELEKTFKSNKFSFDFDVDFSKKRLEPTNRIYVIPENQRNVDAVVTFKNGNNAVGLILKEDGSLEVAGDFYGSGYNEQTFAQALGMTINANRLITKAKLNNYTANVVSQTREQIKLEFTM